MDEIAFALEERRAGVARGATLAREMLVKAATPCPEKTGDTRFERSRMMTRSGEAVHDPGKRNSGGRLSRVGAGKGGFSLIEVLIVLAVVGVTVAISLPVLSTTMNRRQAEGAAERLASDLREARSLALRLGVTHSLHSGNDTGVSRPGQYRIEWTDPVSGQPRRSEWYNPSSDYRGASLGPIQPKVGAVQYLVVFSPQGTMPGVAGVTFPLDINVTGQGVTRTIRVERNGSISLLPL
jgi:prepilin-type N-terminal cleavage/methylation domain-containing protein